MESMRCVISGKVQGVYFRAWTKEQADSLGIKGWVRNISEGRVEVLAQGGEEPVKEFKTRLIQGSSMSEVKNIECETMDYDKEYSIFEIR
ncbi:acylphosphatase [Desulfonatronovibrio magnus]|uniref:acylphosphatase n=1 Tax=Desulfonatronovibrio magnus TaxID=698827 RepID=UPI0005EAE682|nr:acylphosphatase [Desulfonatronovibrio magnus]